MNILQAIQDGLPVRVISYRAGSASATALAAYISTQCSARVRLRTRDPVNVPGVNIRWGKGAVSVRDESTCLNNISAVSIAANKLDTFNALYHADVPAVQFTTSRDTAGTWLSEGSAVVARHKLTGHSGIGIQIVGQSGDVYRCATLSDNTPWYAARVFTKYFKRAAEYRVFVVGQNAVLAYRKGAASDVEEGTRQFMVRTHATGWNFCSVELSEVPEKVLQASIQAVQAIGLHFGAVDIGWNDHKQECAVFEVNTAPGMQGGTVAVVAEALVRCNLGPVRPVAPPIIPAVLHPLHMDDVTREPTRTVHINWSPQNFFQAIR